MKTLHFLKVIGSGAFGTVYLAEMLSSNNFRRRIAVKVLLSERASQPGASTDFMTRVRDEARLLGLLQDDEILQVLSLDVIDGKDSILMEYVEGIDLSSAREALVPISHKAVAEIGAITAGVLSRAHNAVDPRTQNPLNVIHRDIKPANIMVTKNGGIKVCDFGVAKARFDGQESITQPDLLLGTLQYMAPEYIITGQVSPAADIYGLGLSLLEIATGHKLGKPKLRKDEHEQRVQIFLADLSPSPRLKSTIESTLLWDAKQRPTGREAETLFYAAAEELKGLSLRRWASQTVPQLLQSRGEIKDLAGLLGQQISINTGPTTIKMGDQPQPAQPQQQDQASVSEPGIAYGNSTELMGNPIAEDQSSASRPLSVHPGNSPQFEPDHQWIRSQLTARNGIIIGTAAGLIFSLTGYSIFLLLS